MFRPFQPNGIEALR
ncbi:unnamed protein product, partial [Adineta steineri]